MFSAIFAGVASLAGAVLTRRDARKEAARVAAANKAEAARIQKANEAAAAKAKKQNTQVRQNYYKNVVKDAQSAGINPLTALRTGGGAGYATAVAGTIANPVMMEGVYEIPTLSRNPLAAGLEAGTNTYLSELTRQKQYTHESRMDELRKSLMRAQIKSMSAELSRTNLPGFGDDTITTSVLPGDSSGTEELSLEELMAASPLRINIKETPSGTNAANTISPSLFPLALPYTNKTIMVPWNPEDSDLGAIVGGTAQYMGTLGVELGMSLGTKIDKFRLSRSLGNQPGFTMAPNFSAGFK